MKMEELIQNKLRQIFNDDKIVFDKSRVAGGLTNYNYIISIHGEDYVIRQPGGMTNLMIDRKIERANNLIASEFGVNADCIYFDDETGIKISIYVKNSRNIAQNNPCSKESIEVVSGMMKKIHQSNINFTNDFHWQKELAKYEKIIENLNGSFFFDYGELKKNLMSYMENNITNLVSRPCHNDTVPENFLIADTGKAYLVDWEYSGNNDPSWDIAAYILESRLTEDAIDYLITNYYGNYPDKEEIKKIKFFMVAQDLLWMVWAMVRHYSGDDFLDYCSYRYERFQRNIKALINSSDCSLADLVKN